jgi:2-methylcitrate dehydratase PrpD
MIKDTTLQFVKHIRGVKFEDIQPEAVARAKLAVLDIVAVSLGAAGSDIASRARMVAALGADGKRAGSSFLVQKCQRIMPRS